MTMAKKTKATFTVEMEYSGPEKSIRDLFDWSARIEKIFFKDIVQETTDIGVQSKYGDTKKIIRSFLKAACKDAGLVNTKTRNEVQQGEYNLFYVSGNHSWKIGVQGDLAIAYCGGVIEIHLDKQDSQSLTVEVYDRHDPIETERAKEGHWRSPHWERYDHSPNEKVKLNMANPDLKDELVKVLKRWGTKHARTFDVQIR
jgi:hypothetical protein